MALFAAPHSRLPIGVDIFLGKGAINFWALEDRAGANAVSSNVTADVGTTITGKDYRTYSR